jgi:hypothetical protein
MDVSMGRRNPVLLHVENAAVAAYLLRLAFHEQNVTSMYFDAVMAKMLSLF